MGKLTRLQRRAITSQIPVCRPEIPSTDHLVLAYELRPPQNFAWELVAPGASLLGPSSQFASLTCGQVLQPSGCSSEHLPSYGKREQGNLLRPSSAATTEAAVGSIRNS